ncbi:SpoIIE family protein phosphatase [Xylophilus sp. Kf1]|nr:SpoIIE family protein phosphatase [Xylophilus sp. Kf1]
MQYHFHALTDPGRVRTNNEDVVLHDVSVGLGVVADGMGGYRAGEIASSIAAAYMQEHFATWLAIHGEQATNRAIRGAMRRYVRSANQSIMAVAEQQPECQGMGTTLVLGVFQAGRVMVGSIGDSRFYRLRRNRLERISHDHSWLQEQIDAGLIDESQAQTAPNRNIITRGLGFPGSGELDVFELEPEPGDLYLLCSDGLTDMLTDARIARLLLAAGGSLETGASSLVDAANAAGGRDNVSVLLVLSEGAPAARSSRFFRWRRS